MWPIKRGQVTSVPGQTSKGDTLRAAWPWLALTLVALLLRIWELPAQLLADDEWHALHMLLGASPLEIYTTFGHADHSIPLTLAYQALSSFTPLSENLMRLPMLGAGVGAILIMPLLLGKAATKREKLIFSALLSIAPILVYFSRTARPYALTVLLAFVAVLAFYWWWHHKHRHWAALYIGSTVLAAWLHPLTLATTLAPFVWRGPAALYGAISKGTWSPGSRLLGLGVLTFIPLSLLLAPPLIADFQALSGKSGVDRVSWNTLWKTLQLFSGSGNPPWTLLWIGLFTIGLVTLAKSRPSFTVYLACIIAVTTGLIVATGGAWIHHPLVLARYLLPLLPIGLFFVAVGIGNITRPLPTPLYPALMVFGLLTAYFIGPLPAQYHAPPNQFTGHMAYQFDYNAERNLYNRQLSHTEIPDFYRELGKRPPGRYTLVKAPWYIEWHWNTWHLHQAVHGQRVMAGMITGLCAGEAFGEYQPETTRVALKHAVHLQELAAGRSKVDFLVIHRTPPQAGARPIPNWDACLRIIDNKFGPAVHEEDAVRVYRVGN